MSFIYDACVYLIRKSASAVAGSKEVSVGIAIAMISLADSLRVMVDATILTDIRKYKDGLFRRFEAGTKKLEAEAEQEAAKAVDLANKATLSSRKDTLAKLEKDALRAQLAKTQAETDAIKMDAETRRMQAIAEAEANLLDKLSILRQHGGEIFVNKKNLQEIINNGRQPYQFTYPCYFGLMLDRERLLLVKLDSIHAVNATALVMFTDQDRAKAYYKERWQESPPPQIPLIPVATPTDLLQLLQSAVDSFTQHGLTHIAVNPLGKMVAEISITSAIESLSEVDCGDEGDSAE